MEWLRTTSRLLRKKVSGPFSVPVSVSGSRLWAASFTRQHIWGLAQLPTVESCLPEEEARTSLPTSQQREAVKWWDAPDGDAEADVAVTAEACGVRGPRSGTSGPQTHAGVAEAAIPAKWWQEMLPRVVWALLWLFSFWTKLCSHPGFLGLPDISLWIPFPL